MRTLVAFVCLAAAGAAARAAEPGPVWDPAAPVLGYHRIRVDASGSIVSWAADEPAVAFDKVIRLVWRFWDGMAQDRNGAPYFLLHQVWNASIDDARGLGGDQVAMALDSWALLYGYMGQGRDRIVANMRLLADHVLAHGMSPPNALWPNLPFPYNTLTYGPYDGDMVLGRGYLQPDKAGSFGAELVVLWKMTGNARYLEAAIGIADTLAARVKAGDAQSSPLPFKVHATTGKVGELRERDKLLFASYTSNFAPTLELFEALAALPSTPPAKSGAYRRAHDVILGWMKRVPLATMKWGPFFEDVWGWSDTQINAVTFASYIMEHPAFFPGWKAKVRDILDWVERELGNDEWKRLGVRVVNEQTAYRVPGNSHTARQAAAELRLAELTGDDTHKVQAVRRLAWATYMVGPDGRNCYPRDSVWLTDGYGDYVRHYLRAMAAAPELAPPEGAPILRTSSVVTRVTREARSLRYETFDPESTELIRLPSKPKRVAVGDDELPELAPPLPTRAWMWQPVAAGQGGVLRVRHQTRGAVSVSW